MNLPNATTGHQPILLYRSTCLRCRLLSWFAIVLSRNHIRRISINSEEADQLYDLHNETRGRLALFSRNQLITSWRVVPAALEWFFHLK